MPRSISTKSAVAAITLALAAGAPGLAQTAPDRALAGAAEAPAEPVKVYRTPAPVEEGGLACDAAIDCAPTLEGEERARPTRVWAVRSSHAPADFEPQPYVPIAVIVDVDAEQPRRRPRRPRR
jgi:hypothetical protein